MIGAIAACSSPAQREFGKADQAAIGKLAEDFTAAYNAKDAEKVAALFSGGGGLMPPNAPTVRGTQSVREYFVGRFAQGAADLRLDPKEISGSGPLAYASGDFSLKLAPPGGAEIRDRGKFLWVVRDFSGKWLLDSVIFSSDFPAAPTPATAPPAK